jgi:hypothetical protein
MIGGLNQRRVFRKCSPGWVERRSPAVEVRRIPVDEYHRENSQWVALPKAPLSHWSTG